MKKLRLYGKLTWFYIIANKKLFTIVALATFALFYFFPQISPLIFKNKPDVIGYAGNYTIATLPRFIQNEISFGLTKLTADNQATAGAAISWVATDSGKTVAFKLNPNLKFQDGQKLTAALVNYNLKGVTVEKTSDYDIKFSLKEPFAPLINLLSQPIFKDGLVGLGDNQAISLKFAGRFLSNLELKNINTNQTKLYKFYPSESQLLTALRLGAVKKVFGVRQPPAEEMQKEYKIESQIDGNTEAMLFYNSSKKPFDDKAIRQGLTYALPDETPYGEPTDSPLPKNHWAFSTAAKKYPQNMDAAKRILGKTGSESAAIKIDLIVNRNLEPVANEIVKAWREAGVDAKVSVSEVLPLDFDAYLTYVDLPSDPDQYILWHSTQTNTGNISGYKSPKVDKLLEEGRKTLDNSDRKDIYASFQKAITEDVPAAFLFYPKVYSISKR